MPKRPFTTVQIIAVRQEWEAGAKTTERAI